MAIITHTFQILVDFDLLADAFLREARPHLEAAHHKVDNLQLVLHLLLILAGPGEAIADDGDEHVDQGPHHQHHVEEEEKGAENAVRFDELLEVEFTCSETRWVSCYIQNIHDILLMVL